MTDMTIYLPDATPEIVLQYAGGDEQGDRLKDLATEIENKAPY